MNEEQVQERTKQQDIGWNTALNTVRRFGAMLTDDSEVRLGDLRDYIDGLKK